jgi:hypothetical protein
MRVGSDRIDQFSSQSGYLGEVGDQIELGLQIGEVAFGLDRPKTLQSLPEDAARSASAAPVRR